jgi:hypothetical protein
MTQDRVCRQCGAEFRGSPHVYYCPECKARLNAKHRASRQKLHVSWSKEKVVEAILERQRQGLPLNWAAVRLDTDYLLAAARHYHGGWNEALAAAGLNPAEISLKGAQRKGVQRKWSRELVIERLQRLHAQHADLSSTSAKAYDLPLYSAAGDFFGGWPEALRKHHASLPMVP